MDASHTVVPRFSDEGSWARRSVTLSRGRWGVGGGGKRWRCSLPQLQLAVAVNAGCDTVCPQTRWNDSPQHLHLYAGAEMGVPPLHRRWRHVCWIWGGGRRMQQSSRQQAAGGVWQLWRPARSWCRACV